MATVVTKTVGPSGRDYTSLSAAITGEVAARANLVTNDEQLIIECDAATYAEGGQVFVNGFTTDATRNIIIRPSSGAEHGGVWGAGVVFACTDLRVADPFVTLQDVEFDWSTTGGGRVDEDNVTLDRILIDSSLATGTSELINTSANNTLFRNCVFVCGARGPDLRSNTATIENCTVIGLNSGIGVLTDSNVTVRNCAIAGFSSPIFGTPGTSTTNATSLSTADGVDFVSPSTGDYTPTTTGALYKAGINPASGFATDITGETRAYWDIGAFASETFESQLKQTITVDPSKVPSDQGSGVGSAGIPLFYDLSNAQSAFWDTVANGGGDIRVFENDGVTELPREVVSCSPPSLSFDGVDDVVNLASATSRLSSADFEIEVVLRSTTDATIYVLGTVGEITNRVYVSSLNSDTEPQIGVKDGGVSRSVEFTGSLFDGDFHTLTIKQDSSTGTWSGTFDGVAGTPNSSGNRALEPMNDIGASGSDYSEVDIASIKIWDDLDRTSLVHDWTVTDATSGTLTDNGSGAINGTISGATTVPKGGELHFLADHVDSVSPTTFKIMADGVSADYASTAAFGSENCWVDAEAVLLMEDATPIDHSGNHTFTQTGTTPTAIAGPQGTSAISTGSYALSNTDASLTGLLNSHDTTISVISRRAFDDSDKVVVGASGGDIFALQTFDSKGGASDGARVYWLDLGANILASTGTAAVDTWLYTSVTTSAAGDHRLYEAGAETDTSTATGATGPFTEFTVGALNSSRANAFSGDIAQVIAWKYALSADRTTTEYNNQSDNASFFLQGTDSATLTHVYNLTTVPSKIAGDLTDYVAYVSGANLGAEVFSAARGDGADLRFYKEGGVLELPREVVSYVSSFFKFGGTSSDYANITTYLDPPATSVRIETQLRLPASLPIANQHVYGRAANSSSNRHGLVLEADGTMSHGNGSTSRIPGPDVTALLGEVVTAVYTHDGTTETITVNGTLVGTRANTTLLHEFDRIGGSGNQIYFGEEIYYINVDWDGTNYRWEPSASSGTTLVDTASGNNATATGTYTLDQSETAEIHLRIPDTLSGTTAETIEVYADGSSADYDVTHPYGRNSVFKDYAAVSHDGGLTDSSGNLTFTQSGSPTAVAGPLTNATEYNGSNQFSEATIAEALQGQDRSFSAWINPDSLNGEAVVGIYDDVTSNNWQAIFADNPNTAANSPLMWDRATVNGDNRLAATSAATIGSWQYVSMGGGDSAIYASLDGGSFATGSAIVLDSRTADNFTIGATGDSSRSSYYDGKIAEVRWRNDHVSQDWITTEYNNQSDASTFWVGSAVGGGTDTTVNVNTATFTLTENTAGIVFDRDVLATSVSLVLTGNIATIGYEAGGETNVAVATAALNLTTYAASLTEDSNVSVGTASLTLTPSPASVAFDRNVTTGTVGLSLTTQTATIADDAGIVTGSVAFTLNTQPASVAYDIDVAASTASLSLSTNTASVSGGVQRQVISIVGVPLSNIKTIY